MPWEKIHEISIIDYKLSAAKKKKKRGRKKKFLYGVIESSGYSVHGCPVGSRQLHATKERA